MTTTEGTLRAALAELRAGRMTMREYARVWFTAIDIAERAGRAASDEAEDAIRAVSTDAVMGRA